MPFEVSVGTLIRTGNVPLIDEAKTPDRQRGTLASH